MSDGRASLVKRSRLPLVLWSSDLSLILGLPSERAGRDFIRTHGIPHCRLGGRIYVRLAALLAFLEAHETVVPTEAESKEKAAEDLRGTAPSLHERQTRQKVARRKPRLT